jgi:hypothetical protein
MATIRVVEIGGTHIRRADIISGTIENLEIERTREVLTGDVFQDLQNFAKKNWVDAIQKLVVLVAGPVRDNTVELMPNFPEFPKNVNLAQELDFRVPTLVFNDMTAAVTGMAHLLKKENINAPFWGLTWSTGLGGKFWDGQKISIDQEVGHDIQIDGIEAEKLLGGRNITLEMGLPPEKITDQTFYLKKARLMSEFLKKLDEIAPTDLFVFKGAIAKNLLANPEIVSAIKSAFDRKIEIILSPEPEKDSLIGAEILAQTT